MLNCTVYDHKRELVSCLLFLLMQTRTTYLGILVNVDVFASEVGRRTRPDYDFNRFFFHHICFVFMNQISYFLLLLMIN